MRDNQNNQSEYIWLTTSYQSHFDSLSMKSDDTREDDLKTSIWFNKNEKEEAEEFLNNLKMFLKKEYYEKYPGRAEFMKDW